MTNNRVEAKFNRFNGHTWIVFIVMILCITAIAIGSIVVLGFLITKEYDETTKDAEIAAIVAVLYLAGKCYIIAGEILTGREVTEKIELPKKD